MDIAIPFGLIIAAFMALSFQQTGVWSSAKTLYENVLHLYPACVEARVNLAETLRGEKRPMDAFNLLKDALQYGDDARLHLHAGYLFAEAGEVPKAREQFQIAQSMAPQDPNPLFALASLDMQTKNKALARKEYEETLKLDPSFVMARVRVAGFLLEDGKEAEAEAELRTALQWNPGSVEAYIALARLLRSQAGREAEAQALLQTVLSIDPENAKAQQLLQQQGIMIQP
jgi:Tfp pilus assembly protein PilF